jgi:homocysteine S-methyltransferase
MTQPVYDPYKVERFLDDVAGLGIPVMLGLCPLASYRNAVFLNENVPGMQVPDFVLKRMQSADERGEGQAEGIAIAREALGAVRDRIQGAYIMPPFGRYRVAMSVLDGFL